MGETHFWQIQAFDFFFTFSTLYGPIMGETGVMLARSRPSDTFQYPLRADHG